MKKIILSILFLNTIFFFAQNVTLYQQFNGNIDFTMFGNTLNTIENGTGTPCAINTSSSAVLNLGTTDIIETAYLYWAGSGSGDLVVTLDNQIVNAERVFTDSINGRPVFSCFTDVTAQIQTTGNATYTLSNLDLTNVIGDYCSTATNFGGWAIIIIYSNVSLPINQINYYDGLQSVSAVSNNLTLELNTLNVIDNIGAKVGFLAWEGDSLLAENETLSINGNLISNPPLNPVNNAFNGTNSFTGANNLYNMDLDFYNIESYINIGDTNATVQLTSTRDFVMINTVLTKLNSQIPDATIQIDSYGVLDCNTREVLVDFTVFNLPEATIHLPINTAISFYAFNGIDTTYISTIYTVNEIYIGDSFDFSEQINIPLDIINNFTLILKVDDENGTSTIIEINETNNTDQTQIELPELPIITQPNALLTCNLGFEQGVFDLTEIIDQITNDATLEITFFTTEEDLIANVNEIIALNNFENTSNPQTIYVRIENPLTECLATTNFLLKIENCIPNIPEVFTPNNDEFNPTFNISGLDNIFLDYKIYIYNRYGNLIYKGENNRPSWDGTYKGKEMPVGTYFYHLHLNDPFYSPVSGWMYLNR